MNFMLEKTIEIVLILICTYAATFISKLIIKTCFKKIIDRAKRSETKKQITTLRGLATYIVNTIIVLFGLMLLLEKFGISLKHLAATAGVMGIAIGFGAKRSVEDLIAGISILVTGQVMIGDIVKIVGITGVVEKINLKLIILRDVEGALHYIRNSTIDTITNYSKDYSYAIFNLPLDFKVNLSDVTNIIKEIGKNLISDKENKMLEEPEILGVDKFEDGAFVLKFQVKTKPGKQWGLKRTFNEHLLERLNNAGIELYYAQDARINAMARQCNL